MTLCRARETCPPGCPQTLTPPGPELLKSGKLCARAEAQIASQSLPEVNALLVTGGDKVYVGGIFQSYNGTSGCG